MKGEVYSAHSHKTESLTPLSLHIALLYPVGCELYKLRQQEVQMMGVLHSLRQIPQSGRVPPKKDGIYSVGEGLSKEILPTIPSALSSEPQAPVSPNASLVHSAFPPQEPMLSGCEDFVC